MITAFIFVVTKLRNAVVFTIQIVIITVIILFKSISVQIIIFTEILRGIRDEGFSFSSKI